MFDDCTPLSAGGSDDNHPRGRGDASSRRSRLLLSLMISCLRPTLAACRLLLHNDGDDIKDFRHTHKVSLGEQFESRDSLCERALYCRDFAATM
jgi:hypothetical protein